MVCNSVYFPINAAKEYRTILSRRKNFWSSRLVWASLKTFANNFSMMCLILKFSCFWAHGEGHWKSWVFARRAWLHEIIWYSNSAEGPDSQPCKVGWHLGEVLFQLNVRVRYLNIDTLDFFRVVHRSNSTDLHCFAYEILPFGSVYKPLQLCFRPSSSDGLLACLRVAGNSGHRAITIFFTAWIGFVEKLVTETKKTSNGRLLATNLRKMNLSSPVLNALVR